MDDRMHPSHATLPFVLSGLVGCNPSWVLEDDFTEALVHVAACQPYGAFGAEAGYQAFSLDGSIALSAYAPAPGTYDDDGRIRYERALEPDTGGLSVRSGIDLGPLDGNLCDDVIALPDEESSYAVRCTYQPSSGRVSLTSYELEDGTAGIALDLSNVVLQLTENFVPPDDWPFPWPEADPEPHPRCTDRLSIASATLPHATPGFHTPESQ